MPEGTELNPIDELHLTYIIPLNLHYSKRIEKVHLSDNINWRQLDLMEGLDSIIQVKLDRLSILHFNITELPSWLSELPSLTHMSIWDCRSLSNTKQLDESLLGCPVP